MSKNKQGNVHHFYFNKFNLVLIDLALAFSPSLALKNFYYFMLASSIALLIIGGSLSSNSKPFYCLISAILSYFSSPI